MNVLSSIFHRLRNSIRAEVLDRELSAELSAHLELHIMDNLGRGMAPEEARRDALLKLAWRGQTEQSFRHAHIDRGLPMNATTRGTFSRPASYLSCGLTTEGPVSFCCHHAGAAYA